MSQIANSNDVEAFYDSVSELFLTNEVYQGLVIKNPEHTFELLSKRIYNKNSKIVDLGCGNGSFLNYLNRKGFNNTIGIVNSIKIRDIANKLYPNLNIQYGDMLEYLDHNKDIDYIFNIESFGYVECDEYFSRASKALANKGRIILKDFDVIGKDERDVGKEYGGYLFRPKKEITDSANKFGLSLIHFDYPINTTREYFIKAMHSINLIPTASSDKNGKRVNKCAIYVFLKD